MATGWKTRCKIAEAMANRTNFEYGNISGEWTEEHNLGYTGRLPDNLLELLKEQHRDKDIFVVRSYGTPIAWAFDQRWFIPHVSYSMTTSHHQSVIRAATLPPGQNPYLK